MCITFKIKYKNSDTNGQYKYKEFTCSLFDAIWLEFYELGMGDDSELDCKLLEVE